MYIWKIVIKYENGRSENEWVCAEQGESVADAQSRADDRVDNYEHREGVISVRTTRRTVPGI